MITESKERGSTKQTVYQMHSSRQKLEGSAADKKIIRRSVKEQKVVDTGVLNINEASNPDLQKSSI